MSGKGYNQNQMACCSWKAPRTYQQQLYLSPLQLYQLLLIELTYYTKTAYKLTYELFAILYVQQFISPFSELIKILSSNLLCESL